MSRKRKTTRPVKREFARGGEVRASSAPAATWTWSGGSPVFSLDPALPDHWHVQPTEVLHGTCGAGITWQARRVRLNAMPPRSEVQMACYECTITVVEEPGGGGVWWSRPQALGGLVFRPFEILHRPEDGDITLAAKVLSMAVTRPEWALYKEKVEQGW